MRLLIIKSEQGGASMCDFSTNTRKAWESMSIIHIYQKHTPFVFQHCPVKHQASVGKQKGRANNYIYMCIDIYIYIYV